MVALSLNLIVHIAQVKKLFSKGKLPTENQNTINLLCKGELNGKAASMDFA